MSSSIRLGRVVSSIVYLVACTLVAPALAADPSAVPQSNADPPPMGIESVPAVAETRRPPSDSNASPDAPTTTEPSAPDTTHQPKTEAIVPAQSLVTIKQHTVSPAVAPASAGETKPSAESNVVSLAGREGFRWKTQKGDFEFNPYTLVQTYGQVNYVNSRWLALTDQDDVKGVGFGIGNAILGVAGRGFERVTFNLALNPACSGGCLLNQAWMDLSVSPALRFRVGKFKVPAHWAVQVRLGQSLFPRLPVSLIARVNTPFGLNSVNPMMALGFDTGAMVHGVLARRFEYQLGLFNGEGIGVNAPSSTLRDNRGMPGLLYAARIVFYPLGEMKPEETASLEGAYPQVLLGLSSSYNVEANSESSDDFRAGAEAAFRSRGVYLSAEGYLLRMAFTERQRGEAARMFLGGYGQAAIDLGKGLEPIARLEVFDRNSTSERGILVLPAAGLNWYLAGQNLKLSAIYQGLARGRYRTELEAHQDDNAIYDHSGLLQVQFAL